MISLVLGEILGPDLLVILAIALLLFGGSQVPKLARSLGSAKREFEEGIKSSKAPGADAVSPKPSPHPSAESP